MQRLGIPIEKVLVFDTYLAEYTLAGNRKWDLSLDGMSKKYLNSPKHKLVDLLMNNNVCPSTMPESMLMRRCKKDVEDTEKVFLIQRQLLKEQGTLGVLYTKCLFTPVVTDMEAKGMFVDEELVYEIYQKDAEEHRLLSTELDKLTGGINLSSPPQVAKYLYDVLRFKELTDKSGKPIRGKVHKQFPNGMPKTDEDTMVQLKATTKKQRKFLELKSQESKLRKRIGTYHKLFIKACEDHGGMATHAGLLFHGRGVRSRQHYDCAGWRRKEK